MNLSTALILDLVLAVVFIAAVIHYSRRGFMAGLIELIGNFLSLAAAWLVSQKVSPAVFANFFESGLITQTADTIQRQGDVNLNTILEGLTGILPQSFIDGITQSTDGIMQSNAPDLAEQVVEKVIAPLVVPIITVVLFFLVFIICKVVVGFLVAMLTNVNRIPLLGGANRLLGVLVGAVDGAIYVIILLCLVWAAVAVTGGRLPFLNDATLSGSYLYAAFSKYNPFL